MNGKLPPSITKSLGPPAEEVIRSNEEVISKGTERIKRLFIKRKTDTVNNRDAIDSEIEEIRSENDQLEQENEVIEERMSLRDRVKITVFSVVTAVGVVIGVIVSNLKKGLTNVAKGVGNGLKAIGKKIGDILPGMIAAIASFIFKTAGEVIGFLGKNAWLLIVAVVLYLVEQFKKKKR